MSENEKVAVRKMARDFVRKGEFVYSAMLTNSIGEEPIWIPSADQRSLTFRDCDMGDDLTSPQESGSSGSAL